MARRSILSLVTTVFFLAGGSLAYAIPTQQSLQIARSVWGRFQDPDGQFTVLMPGKPVQRRQVQSTEIGDLQITTFAVEQAGLSAHLVTYTDFPADFIASRNATQLLNNGRNEVLNRVQGQLLSEQMISFNGLPGRELKIKAPGGLIIHNRIYLVNQRIYQLIVVAPEQKAANLTGSTRGFFESFQLLSPSANTLQNSPRSSSVPQ